MLGALVIGLAGLLLFAVAFRLLRGRPPARPVPPMGPARPRRLPPRADVPHVLYAAFWWSNAVRRQGRPCYVGISNDLAARQAGHSRRSWWWPLSTRRLTVLGTFPNREAALAAEQARIRRWVARGERLTNTQHNPKPVRRTDVRLAA